MIGFLRSIIGKDKQFYRGVHSMFGFYPNNIDLYKLALIHKSASIILDDGSPINNERLEYLGDAVIEAIVSDMLYIEFPYESEGVLTQMRSKIVSRASLNELALKIELNRYVISQSTSAGSRKHLYGDAFEAMMGAIYLDKGYNFINRLLINRILGRYVNLDDLMDTESDYKSRLIEWCQKKRKQLSIDCKPSDTYCEQEPQFVAVVTIGDNDCGYGIGDSKKEAAQRAAKNAIDALGIKIG